MIAFKEITLTLGNKLIFKDFNWEIHKGEKIVINGKSGSGKSSILKLILGFIQPDLGEVLFNKKTINQSTIWEIRKKTAYIDQDVSLPAMSAMDWMHEVFRYKANTANPFKTNELEKLMEYFEITREELDKDTQELSGGERQRIALILAILLKRKIFLLDEVTSALDNHLKQKVATYFTQQTDATVIIISHDNLWENHSDMKIYKMKDLQCKR